MSSTNIERVSTPNRAFQEEVDLHEEQQSPRFLRTDDRDAAVINSFSVSTIKLAVREERTTTEPQNEELQDPNIYVRKQHMFLSPLISKQDETNSMGSPSLSDSSLSPITDKDHPLDWVEQEHCHQVNSSQNQDSDVILDMAVDGSNTTMSDEQKNAWEQQQASEELARQLMAEEALASYEVSVQFLRDNANNFSEEDMAALLSAMDDERPFMQQLHEQDEDEGEEELLESSSELSYDTLLRLGESLGNVKEERWSLKSQEYIDKLPIVTFLRQSSNDEEEEDHESSSSKCLVCQHTYEEEDCLRKLPCNHLFHRDCIDHWLSTKDFCPYCRQSIIDSE